MKLLSSLYNSLPEAKLYWDGVSMGGKSWRLSNVPDNFIYGAQNLAKLKKELTLLYMLSYHLPVNAEKCKQYDPSSYNNYFFTSKIYQFVYYLIKQNVASVDLEGIEKNCNLTRVDDQTGTFQVEEALCTTNTSASCYYNIYIMSKNAGGFNQEIVDCIKSHIECAGNTSALPLVIFVIAIFSFPVCAYLLYSCFQIKNQRNLEPIALTPLSQRQPADVARHRLLSPSHRSRDLQVSQENRQIFEPSSP